MNNTANPLKWLFLISGIAVSHIPVFYYNDPLVNSLGMIALCVLSMCICGFQPIHPYFWFSGLFTLYSVSYPILYYMGFSNFAYWTYTKETMQYQWVALVVFLLIFTPKNNKKYDFGYLRENIENSNIRFNSTNRLMIRVIELILIFVSLILMSKGYTSKKQIQAAGDIFFSIGERLAMMLDIYFAYYLICSVGKEKESLKDFRSEFIWSIIPIALFTLFTGDRSNAFRYLFYIFTILFSLKILKPRQLLYIVPLGVLFLSASNVFRYFFMNPDLNKVIATDYRTLLYDFLTSDFHCAARNLQVLINDGSTKGIFGYGLIFNDILYTFFRGGSLISVSSWFNKRYFSGSIYGQAFSLVGEGYVIDGYLGVIVLFIIVTLIFKYLYNRSSRNVYWYVLYIVMAGGCALAFREMFMSILSPLFRQCIPVFIIIYLCNKADVRFYRLAKR